MRAWTWYVVACHLVVMFLTVTHCFFAAICCVLAWYFDWFKNLFNSPATVIANRPWAGRASVAEFGAAGRACYMPILTLNCQTSIHKKGRRRGKKKTHIYQTCYYAFMLGTGTVLKLIWQTIWFSNLCWGKQWKHTFARQEKPMETYFYNHY